jgi:sugar phosphate isomerase/epimerase
MTELLMALANLLTEPLVPTPGTVRGGVDAAAASGFVDLSVWAWYLPMLTDDGTLEAARADLDRRGMRVKVVEAAGAWAAGDGGEAEKEAAQMAAAAEATGASVVLAACLGSTLPAVDEARRQLVLLADAARRGGATVAVEFLPWTGLPNLAAAWDLVEPLGGDVGLVIDTWHWLRQPGGGDLELLGSIPADRILLVQLSDAPAAPSGELFDETMQRRLLPGDGAVDFGAVLGCVASSGAKPLVEVEMFNPAFVAEHGAPAAAGAMKQAAQRVLAGTTFAA